ncbi:hypothetical protein, partial [Raoultella ornithinolytica]|uniref:hypothetical protein n=1 Tax=Raoultella ornithinolytica TaxID=54291 RepID=UPI0006613C88
FFMRRCQVFNTSAGEAALKVAVKPEVSYFRASHRLPVSSWPAIKQKNAGHLDVTRINPQVA